MTTTEIKRGEFNAYYSIDKLKMASINRDIFEQHAENFKDKLTTNGWLMPIVVSSKGDVIEGHHRIISAKLLKQKTIPAYIVDWVNTEVEKEHLNCIITLNNGNRAWTTLDYLKAFSKENKDYKKEVSDKVKQTVCSEEYRTNVEPDRIKKIKEAQKQTAQRKIVIEIRKLLDTLSQFKRKKITKELEIKEGGIEKVKKTYL